MTTVELSKIEDMDVLEIDYAEYDEETQEVLLHIGRVTNNLNLLNMILDLDGEQE
jgi:hypothetical protein